MTYRVKVERYFFQLRAASPSLIVIRATSKISLKGIGAGPPLRIALIKDCAQIFCPLSCRHKFIDLNPGQPKLFNRRKLSSCKTLPAVNTSNRSFGNDLLPLAM